MIKILAIDDKQDNLITVKAILKMNLPDCQVHTALSGVEGIEIAINEEPDAILLDIKMPGMDGYEVCKELKSSQLTKHIPVIMLTAIQSDSVERAKAFDIGADAFLSKPIDEIELTAQIKAMYRIKTAEDKLRAKNVILEELVAKKTWEISEKNVNLENKIAEIKVVQKKLKESEQQFRFMAENAQDVIYRMRIPDGIYEYVSPASTKMFGYTPDEFYANPILIQKIIHPDWHQYFEIRWNKLINNDMPAYYEYQIIHKSGEVKWVNQRNTALRDTKGNIIAIEASITDVSERKKAEEEIKRQNIYIQSILDNFPIGIATNKIDNNEVTYINAKFSEIYGWPKEAFPTTIDFFNKVFPDKKEREILQAKIIADINSGDPARMKWDNLEITCKNGEKRSVFAYNRPLYDQNTMISTVQDITEGKKIEETLKENETKLKNIIENSTNLFYSHSENHEITFISPQVYEYLGYEKDEVMQNWTSFVTDNPMNKKAIEFTEKAIQTGKRQPTYELEMVRKDGKKIIVEVREAPVVENGKVVSIVGSLTDISNRKKHEEKILEQNKEYEAINEEMRQINEELHVAKESIETNKVFLDNIINNIGDPIFVKDAQIKLLMVNDAFCSLFNLTRSEVIGQTLTENVSPEESENFVKTDKSIIKTGQEIIVEETITIKGKKPLTVLTRKKRFKDKNGKVYLIGIIRDITQRKLMEIELLKAKEKAEESDRLKTAFLANMSHEIRTPLNAVLGFSQILARKTNVDIDEKTKLANYIKINGDSLVKIIDDIIDISKIESKQMNINVRDFNLHLVLDELKRFYDSLMLQNLKTKVKLNIETAYPLNEDFYIKTDGQRLKQILNNLISNALNHTDKGNITFGYQIQNNELRFFVKDTGSGISQKNLESIFDRFVQISQKYVSRHEGTGLGLAISKNMVQLLGGELKVESEVKKGSHFYFSLPWIKGKAKSIRKTNGKSTTKKNDLSQLNILIADDEESNYMLSNRILRPTGAKTEWAQNGKQAVEMIKRSTYDLVLMDIKMPEMDGIEATRILKKLYPNLPIIIQTAFAMGEVKDEAMQANCDGFIVKPISIDAFNELIQKHIKL